jgi:hypothetical protein
VPGRAVRVAVVAGVALPGAAPVVAAPLAAQPSAELVGVALRVARPGAPTLVGVVRDVRPPRTLLPLIVGDTLHLALSDATLATVVVDEAMRVERRAQGNERVLGAVVGAAVGAAAGLTPCLGRRFGYRCLIAGLTTGPLGLAVGGITGEVIGRRVRPARLRWTRVVVAPPTL